MKTKSKRRSAKPRRSKSLVTQLQEKWNIDWNFPVEFVKPPADNEVRSVTRNEDGVWEATNAEGKTVAFFGDNFARAIGLVEPRRKLRSAKSGSIAEPRTERESTQYEGKIRCQK